MDPYFVEGVYNIKKVGEYSDLVETQFGFHIIRLDALKEKSYKPDAEVLPGIKAELENKYRNLAIAAFTSKLVLSTDATVDDKAIEELLAKYKTKTEKPQKPKGVVIKQFIRK
jgi:parvulin-like peptidyl-prolyl isomerase